MWSKIIENKINNQRNLLKHLSKSELSVARLETYRKNVLENVGGSDRRRSNSIKNIFKRYTEINSRDLRMINSALNYGYMVLRAIISSKLLQKDFIQV